MTEDVSSLILEHLRAIRGDIAEIKRRIDSLESRMSAMEDYMRGMFTHLISLQHDVSVNTKDIALIKRRLDLVDVE